MNLYNMLLESAQKHPDATCFIFRDKSYSYHEVVSLVDKCADGLFQMGVVPGATFGIVLRNCPEFVITIFALAKSGASCVPVNFLEKAERLKLIFSDANILGCVTSKEFLSNVESATRDLPGFSGIFVTDLENAAGGEALSCFSTGGERIQSFEKLLESSVKAQERQEAKRSRPLGDVEENAVAVLLYTSGTTGLPKGVMLSHKNFLANVVSCLESIEVSREDRFICLLPMFHSFALTTCVFIPIRLGTSFVIIETIMPFEPVIKAIWHHKITVFTAVPPLYAAIGSRITGLKSLMLKFLNPVRICISGASALPVEVAKSFEKVIGVPVLEGYGLTETAPVVSLNPVHAIKIGTVGKPVKGVQVKIVNDDELPLALGEVGEICVKGDNVMLGYRNQPEETKRVFSRDGWFKTGDMGKLDIEGYLTIVDRKKDIIIVKGLNVYPQEVEIVLLSHTAVKEAAVVGLADDTGDEIIKGFITLKEGQQVPKTELLRLCREKLAPYKCPKDIEILPELPKNALGKILKKDLRKNEKTE